MAQWGAVLAFVLAWAAISTGVYQGKENWLRGACGTGFKWWTWTFVPVAVAGLLLTRWISSTAAGSGHIDFAAACARAPRGMICLNSAIAYWSLSDEIPAVVHLAVPEGFHRPVIDYPPTKIHVFQETGDHDRTAGDGDCRDGIPPWLRALASPLHRHRSSCWPISVFSKPAI